MTPYTVGFAFDTRRQLVALIQKARPKWQAGLHNGIGGHVEPLEDADVCQSREFHEETGVLIPANQWEHYAWLHGPGYTVVVYRTFTDDVLNVKSLTDEPVSLCPVRVIAQLPIIDNLGYLIPMALDPLLKLDGDKSRFYYEKPRC